MNCRIFICRNPAQGDSTMTKSLISLFFMLLVTVPVFAADGLRPGYWQVDSTVEIPNMPALLTSASANYCISKDEARDPRRLVFRQKDCIFTAFSKANNRLTWKMNCSGRNQGTLTGEALLGGDTFESTMQLRSGDNLTTLLVNARRLGECPRQAADAAAVQPRPGAGKRP